MTVVILHAAFATAMMIAAVALAVLAWRDGGVRFARWRALRSRMRAARHGPLPSPATLRGLRAAMPEVRQRLPHADGAAPTVAQAPWLLFLGDTSAALPALLATAAPAGPVVPAVPLEDDEPFWRWWALPRMVAIEVRPPPLEPVPQDLLWSHAMRALVQARPTRPLDGVALCASVAVLRADPAATQPLLQLLARRVHEIAATLCLRLPLHLVVTGLQDLPGYASVRAGLPETLAAQALGWRPAPDAAAAGLAAALQPIEDALQALRLGLLMQAHDARERHDIHRFFEAVLGLQPGLQRLHEALQLSAQGGHPGITWQGLYLTAAAPQGAFVADLFERFLPWSRALTHDAG